MQVKNDNDNNDNACGRRATLKQVRFAAAYVDPQGAAGNGVAAARAAGYQGSARTLAVTASMNLRKPAVQNLIATAVDRLVEHGLDRVAEALDATRKRRVGDEIVCESDHRIRLDAVKFLFTLRTKHSAAASAAEEGSQANCDTTVEEAIKAAGEVLELWAPHLLARPMLKVEESTDTGVAEHQADLPEQSEQAEGK